MTSTTPSPELEATTTCTQCGQMFRYEPIISYGGFDLGLAVNQICFDCETRAAQAAEAAAIETRRAETLARIAAIIPEDIRETDTTHPEFNARLWQAVRAWRPSAASFWLGIIGHAGKCKTRCMALLAIRAMHAGVSVTWTTAHRLKDSADDRKSWDRQAATVAREHLEACRRAPWLFIDDLGKTEWNSAFEAELFKLLDYRKTHRLATVFSSNAHPDEFSQLITPMNAGPLIGRLLDRTAILRVSA